MSTVVQQFIMVRLLLYILVHHCCCNYFLAHAFSSLGTHSYSAVSDFRRRSRQSILPFIWLHAQPDTHAQLRHDPDYVDHDTSKEDVQTDADLSMNSNDRIGWMARARQLHDFAQQHGHTLVPKRYNENPALGNWVNKQRQEYRRYLIDSRPCSLTPKRIEILNLMGFCWDASHISSKQLNVTEKQQKQVFNVIAESNECPVGHQTAHNSSEFMESELSWYWHIQELRQANYSSLTEIPRTTRHGAWLQKLRQMYAQRQQETEKRTGKKLPLYASTSFSSDIFRSLSEIDPDWWMTRREFQWERRYRELINYRQTHGDCCVPISYENKQLANWVSHQRKEYNRRQKGLPSDMTKERQERLEKVGFVWDRWEYEFLRKRVKEGKYYSYE